MCNLESCIKLDSLLYSDYIIPDLPLWSMIVHDRLMFFGQFTFSLSKLLVTDNVYALQSVRSPNQATGADADIALKSYTNPIDSYDF